MEALKLLEKYYSQNPLAYPVLLAHGKAVAQKALAIAKQFQEKNNIQLNLVIIEEAALLHDIGIMFIEAPDIGCHGDSPYVCHGYLGAELLRKEKLPVHALICERHVGMGLSTEEIITQQLPLPHHDMIPHSWEEKIVSFADKFFSKNKQFLTIEKPLEKIREGNRKWGEHKVRLFDEWYKLFLY